MRRALRARFSELATVVGTDAVDNGERLTVGEIHGAAAIFAHPPATSC
ncbi:hypothetical protein [Nocardia sp. NRRL WC-3656]|nr:hypothetical protein [Nocardia sp. NRRL WC-3656]